MGLARALLILVAMLAGGCGAPEPDPPTSAVTDRPTLPSTTPEPVPDDLLVIPPSQGTYYEMWAGLRELQSIVKPLSTASAKAMLETLREQGGSVPAGAVNPQPFIVSEQRGGRQTLWMVLYTDSRMLKPNTYSIEEPVAEALKGVLYSEQLTGVAFNTFTEIAKHQPFEYRVDKLYLAGLIGYLTAEEPEPGKRWMAAKAARDAGSPFETLHHALRSLDDQEDWAQCEVAKLWAMWELDFPGSRAMALEELEWFIDEGHDTRETRALLERFQTIQKAVREGM